MNTTREQQSAQQKDAVLQASIDFISTLTGMTPPPIEVAPPEVFAPFKAFADRVCAIFSQHLPSPAWCASVDAELAATAEADAALTDIQVQAVRDAIAEALGDAYDCTRVWSAWGVGTMDQDDFQLVAEDSDRVAEIADAAIAAMRAPAPAITLPATAVAEGAQLDGDSLEQGE